MYNVIKIDNSIIVDIDNNISFTIKYTNRTKDDYEMMLSKMIIRDDIIYYNERMYDSTISTKGNDVIITMKRNSINKYGTSSMTFKFTIDQFIPIMKDIIKLL